MTIADRQRRFYERLFARHGDSPRALSYRDRETQFERFERLGRLFGRESGRFTVHEVGCGLGHFGEFLAERFPAAVYSGSDISPQFVERCRARFPESDFRVRDPTTGPAEDRYDFVTTSGMFNPRRETPPDAWRGFIFAMLEAMYGMAGKGIGANFLTTYHDADRTDPDLHYQDPRELTDFAVERLSRHYAIDAAGPLYEYTLVVLRPEYVHRFYDEAAFAHYFRER
jgi:SAM-dependent methyltransferase